jgi:hypothetical protein
MSSDDQYADFLSRANQDVSGGGSAKTTSQSRPHAKPKSEIQISSSDLPKELSSDKIQSAVYISDTDSEFEPVGFSFEGGELPDGGMAISLVYAMCCLKMPCDTPLYMIPTSLVILRYHFISLL